MTTDSESVDNVLGKPVAADLGDDALKVRRNLLIASFVSLVSVMGNVHVDPTSTVFGLKFTGMTTDLLNKGLFTVELYLLAHFAWYVFDSFLEWRIRLTGTRTAFITAGTFGSEHADYPSDPRQSTLYNWWRQQGRQLALFPESLAEVTTFLDEWQQKVDVAMSNGNDAEKRAAVQSIEAVRIELNKLRDAVTGVERIVLSARIPASLARFEGWFALFLRSQNLRWFFIDAAMPLCFGVAAALYLAREIWS